MVRSTSALPVSASTRCSRIVRVAAMATSTVVLRTCCNASASAWAILSMASCPRRLSAASILSAASVASRSARVSALPMISSHSLATPRCLRWYSASRCWASSRSRRASSRDSRIRSARASSPAVMPRHAGLAMPARRITNPTATQNSADSGISRAPSWLPRWRPRPRSPVPRYRSAVPPPPAPPRPPHRARWRARPRVPPRCAPRRPRIRW